MLRVEGVDSYYGGFQALEQISLHVPAGQTVIVVGPNGAGKSTLMRTLCGLHRPRAGSVRFEGRTIHGKPAHEVVELGISLVPEGGRVFPHLTVQDNLRVGSFPKRARGGVTRSLERVYTLFPRLEERKKQLAGSLSGGERQMLAIGRSLMSEPKLILLDEPSLGLAPLVVDMVFGVVRRMREEGYSVLLVEQNAKKALQVADYAYLVESGRLLFEGKRDDFDKHSYIREAYLGI